MGNVQVAINGTDLDNGSWRRIVDWPAVIRSDDGAMEKLAIDFIVEADSASDMDTRFESTYNDLTMKSPRVQLWLDDAKAEPTLDWYVGDGKHIGIVSVVTVRPEMVRTQKKIHFTLVVSCDSEAAKSPPQVPSGISDITGLETGIEVVKTLFDSERYTLTASGIFVSTLNESAEGPYDLASVANNGGKARFALEAPDVIVAAFDEGMFIDVSSPSAYQGRHFITAISGGGATIDTATPYVSVEGDVNASVLVGTTSTAEDNFAAGKNQILTILLETGDDGQPNAVSPHMTKISEIISFTSEQKDALQFVLGSAPEAQLLNATSGGDYVQRGLQYNIRFQKSGMWDSKLVEPVVNIIVEGKVAIQKAAITPTFDLHFWWKEMEEEILANVESVANQRFGGSLKHRNTEVSIDYSTYDVQFTIACTGAYKGTLSYSYVETFATQQPRTIWTDTDGYDHIHEPKMPARRNAIISVEWTGDSGNRPPEPKPPSESGFEYLYDSDEVTSHKQLEDEDGSFYDSISMRYHYTRVRRAGSGGGGGGSGGGGDSHRTSSSPSRRTSSGGASSGGLRPTGSGGFGAWY